MIKELSKVYEPYQDKSAQIDNCKLLVFIDPIVSDSHRTQLVSELEQQSHRNFEIVEEICVNENDVYVVIRNHAELYPQIFERLARLHTVYKKLFTYSDYLDITSEKEVYLPAWSPIRFEANDYLGNVLSFSGELVKSSVQNKSFNDELLETLISYANEICRIPEVLYSSASNIRIKHSSNKRADGEDKVSIIIPTRGTVNLKTGKPYLYDAVGSIATADRSKLSVEVILVIDSDTDSKYAETLVNKYSGSFSIKTIKSDPPFNFSYKCNLGTRFANNEKLLFLNDDAFFQDANGLSNLAGYLDRDSVGAVGALLFYPDMSIQHAGQIVRNGHMTHAFHHQSFHEDLNLNLTTNHEVSGVTGACLGVKRTLLEQVGGWNENYPNSYNDVDLCFRIRDAGKSIVQVNSSRLFHSESVSRDAGLNTKHYRLLVQEWSAALTFEPFMRNGDAFGNHSEHLSTHGKNLKSMKGHYLQYLRYILRNSGFSGLSIALKNRVVMGTLRFQYFRDLRNPKIYM
jgi:GT2 family glycosyltransferase